MTSNVLAVGDKPPPGRCYTCSREAKLTWAHIPPACVGNVGDMKVMNDVDPITRAQTNTLSYKRGFREGGIRVKHQCGACNGVLSKYDGALKSFWEGGLFVRATIVGRGDLPPECVVSLEGIDPGAVIRSLVGALSALNDDVANDYPELVRAVLDNTPYSPPSDLLLGLGLHTGTKCNAISGYQHLGPPDRRLARLLLQDQIASLAFPPYSFVIRREAAIRDPHANIGGWLNERAGHRRSVALVLPVLADVEVGGPIQGDEPVEMDSMRESPFSRG